MALRWNSPKKLTVGHEFDDGSFCIFKFSRSLRADALALERMHPSSCPATKQKAEKSTTWLVEHYNHVRLHSAIEHITPANCMVGLSKLTNDERDRELETARE